MRPGCANRPLVEVTVADDMVASVAVLGRGLGVDAGGDLRLDGFAHYLACQFPNSLGEVVVARRPRHDADVDSCSGFPTSVITE